MRKVWTEEIPVGFYYCLVRAACESLNESITKVSTVETRKHVQNSNEVVLICKCYHSRPSGVETISRD